MAKPLKILLCTVGGFLLLFMAAVIALPLLFDPNDYRDQIAKAVKKETGRAFAVGDIRLAVFPWIRVELHEVTLGNAEGFGSGSMLTVQRAEVGARLMPLLREKRVEASTVMLEGVMAHLTVDAQGRNNWQDLLPKPAIEVPANQPTLQQQMQRLDIKGLTLSDVRLIYDDQQSGKQYQLDGLQLKTGRVHASDPVTVEGGFKLASSAPVLRAAVDFSSTVALNGQTGDVRLSQLRFKLDAQQPSAAPLAATLALAAESLTFSKASQTFSSTGPLELNIGSLVIGAPEKPLLTINGGIKTTLIADLAKQFHRFDGLDVALQVAGSAMPGGKLQRIQLSGGMSVDLAAQQAKLSEVRLEAFDLKVSAKQWLLSQLDSAPQLVGDLAIAPFAPRALLAILDIAAPETADAGTLKTASLNAQLMASAKSASFEHLMLKLDDTTVQGRLGIRDFATQAISFALKADRLDADRYLPSAPKPGASVGAAATPAAKAQVNDTALPIDMLDKLNAQGTLEVASMKLKNLKLANVRLKLDGAAGATHRQQLAASLYGGSADMSLSVAPGAKHALRLSLSGINAAPLLKDFIDSDKLSGKGSMTLDVTSAGRTVAAVKRGLDGKLAFNLVDGAVKGFNLGKIIRDGQALLSAQASAATSTAQSTDFAELRGSGVFTNGVLQSDQLSAKNPLLRLEGAGEIDLVKETINYLAKPTLVNTASGQGGKERIDLSGIVVPIRLRGDLYKPKVSIDWQTALKQQAVGELREKLGVSEEVVRENREALRAKAKEEIGKGLLKLFGSKSSEPPADPAP